jgi:hypothetical protein
MRGTEKQLHDEQKPFPSVGFYPRKSAVKAFDL